MKKDPNFSAEVLVLMVNMDQHQCGFSWPVFVVLLLRVLPDLVEHAVCRRLTPMTFANTNCALFSQLLFACV